MSRQQKTPSIGYLIGCWIAAVISLLLLIPTGGAIFAEASSFRSCSVNSAGLFVSNCGKQGLNVGDGIILALFLGAVAVVMSLVTHSVRMSKRIAQ